MKKRILGLLAVCCCFAFVCIASQLFVAFGLWLGLPLNVIVGSVLALVIFNDIKSEKKGE